MRWFLDLTTRTKLLLGFGLTLLLLMVVVATAYRSIQAIQESQKNLYEVPFANAMDLLSLRTNENGVRAALLDMILVTKRSEQETFYQDIQKRSKTIEEITQRLLQRNRDDAQLLRRIEELNAIRDAFRQTRDKQLIPVIYEGKVEEAKTLVLGIQAERSRKIRAICEELGNEAEEKARRAVVESEKSAGESDRILVVTGAVAFLLSIGFALLMNWVIAGPLKEISGVATRVASGDLTVNLPAGDRADEVGALALTFRRMVDSLQTLNRQIREGANVLAASASEILAATAQVASGATETATAVSETTTTVEEVKQTAQLSTQKAKYVSESSQKSAQVSQAGRKAVEETIVGMNRIQEQVTSIAESIVRLSEQSQAIGEIIATVNDLAEQSNLLAVNAAIEAAKAGEQGKGFAVVAQEVRNLAEQSKQATAQVRTILGDIQKATAAAVLATEQGGKAVEAGVRQSSEASEAIRKLTESIAEAAQAATQIAASAQQQLVGMDQVVLAMENIKQASTQNVASTKQAETAAQNLHDLGQKLKQLVEQFKV